MKMRKTSARTMTTHRTVKLTYDQLLERLKDLKKNILYLLSR